MFFFIFESAFVQSGNKDEQKRYSRIHEEDKKKIPQLSDKTSCLADNTGSVQAQASVYECICVRERMY